MDLEKQSTDLCPIQWGTKEGVATCTLDHGHFGNNHRSKEGHGREGAVLTLAVFASLLGALLLLLAFANASTAFDYTSYIDGWSPNPDIPNHEPQSHASAIAWVILGTTFGLGMFAVAARQVMRWRRHVRQLGDPPHTDAFDLCPGAWLTQYTSIEKSCALQIGHASGCVSSDGRSRMDFAATRPSKTGWQSYAVLGALASAGIAAGLFVHVSWFWLAGLAGYIATFFFGLHVYEARQVVRRGLSYPA